MLRQKHYWLGAAWKYSAGHNAGIGVASVPMRVVLGFLPMGRRVVANTTTTISVIDTRRVPCATTRSGPYFTNNERTQAALEDFPIRSRCEGE